MSAITRIITMKGWKNLHGCQHAADTPWMCEECQRRRDYFMSRDNDLDKEINTIAARDPILAMGHQWATDGEWEQRFAEKYPLRSPG